MRSSPCSQSLLIASGEDQGRIALKVRVPGNRRRGGQALADRQSVIHQGDLRLDPRIDYLVLGFVERRLQRVTCRLAHNTIRSSTSDTAEPSANRLWSGLVMMKFAYRL